MLSRASCLGGRRRARVGLGWLGLGWLGLGWLGLGWLGLGWLGLGGLARHHLRDERAGRDAADERADRGQPAGDRRADLVLARAGRGQGEREGGVHDGTLPAVALRHPPALAG